MLQTYYTYYSTVGTVCVVERPTLTGIIKDKAGRPVAIQHYGNDWGYTTLWGLAINLYWKLKPSVIVYKLADGSLLAADKAELAERLTAHTEKVNSSILHAVANLKILDHLPDEVDIPKYAF